MHIIKGKYNIAKVMLPLEHYPDEATVKQIHGFLGHPAFKGKPIIIMPDTHAGKGAVIGLTMHMNEHVIPNIVGVDIGCGMLSWKLPEGDIDFPALDDFIRNNIPSGSSIHQTSDQYNTRVSPVMRETLDELSERVEQTVDHRKSLGSLGGGNHFIEIVKEPVTGIQHLVIHSGSRNLGYRVCDFHNKKAQEIMKDMFVGDAYRDLPYLPMNRGGDKYIEDMQNCQVYASMNRMTMMRDIATGFFNVSDNKLTDMNLLQDLTECIHNFISPIDNIVRKGAIGAREGEKVIIPLNMRDGILFGIGKGNPEWNNSAPHGAGRIMSRSQAKAELDLDSVKESMEGVWTSSLGTSTIDEAPQAYKDSSMIIDAIKDTVEIQAHAKPVYNFKAS